MDARKKRLGPKIKRKKSMKLMNLLQYVDENFSAFLGKV